MEKEHTEIKMQEESRPEGEIPYTDNPHGHVKAQQHDSLDEPIMTSHGLLQDIETQMEVSPLHSKNDHFRRQDSTCTMRQISTDSAKIPQLAKVTCESMLSWHGDDDSEPTEATTQEKQDNRRCCRPCSDSESEGLEAWLLLIRVMLYNALIGINFSCFGLLYVEYTAHFQASKADVGWVVSIQASVISLLGN